MDQFLDSLLADPRVSLANPYFINSQDSALMVGRTICCKFGDNVSYDFIDSLNEEYNVEIVYENEITPKQFLLSVKDNAEYSTLEIANIYYELEETEFSHPNFLGGLEWHSYFIYDHYWEEQWAMHRIFRAYPGSPDSLNHRVFEITSERDSSIVVAVLDQGVGPHEDMPAGRFVDGYDFANMDDNPSPCDIFNVGCGGHGQCVGGIIGASQNRDIYFINDPNTGIYGIAATMLSESNEILFCTELQFDADGSHRHFMAYRSPNQSASIFVENTSDSTIERAQINDLKLELKCSLAESEILKSIYAEKKFSDENSYEEIYGKRISNLCKDINSFQSAASRISLFESSLDKSRTTQLLYGESFILWLENEINLPNMPSYITIEEICDYAEWCTIVTCLIPVLEEVCVACTGVVMGCLLYKGVVKIWTWWEDEIDSW